MHGCSGNVLLISEDVMWAPYVLDNNSNTYDCLMDNLKHCQCNASHCMELAEKLKKHVM